MELKNVARSRLVCLQLEQKKQSLLLHALQKKEKENKIMPKYVDSREIPRKKKKGKESPQKTTDQENSSDAYPDSQASCTPALSFNQQVSEIILLQDQIIIDYLRVCNIRLHSHQTTLPCPYTKEATDYMSVLTALITT